MRPYELFEKLAIRTWHNIERFNRNRIHLGEDAITSLNLDTILTARPACVAIEDTRKNESKKGCDFELWVGSMTTGWYRYAVQAKKINVISGRYDSLKHELNNKLQIDILDEYAKANNAFAIYCFYNYSLQASRIGCPHLNDVKQLGCTVTPSSVARMAIHTRGARDFTSINNHCKTIPWRCLLRCPNFSKFPIEASHLCHADCPQWNDLSSCFHESLPKVLERALHSNDVPFEALEATLFNFEVRLRPTWVIVVNTDSDIFDDSLR
jgi:hypothetical protein